MSFGLSLGPILSTKFRRYTAIIIIISACLILLLLLLLIIVAVKYVRMRKIVQTSIFHAQQSDEPEITTQPPMTQLTRLPLPNNFASTQQVRTLLNYVNGVTLPNPKDDFKELGRGQYGVVYQVRLPDVGLVAAKLLPQSIRDVERRRDKRKKSDDVEGEGEEMIAKQKETQKTKAAEMLIDELKVMNKAGKHVNIVSLLKVAYPETKFRYLITGGLIRDEDSFYLMELCSNGSLESMLKRFLQPSPHSSSNKSSLYETLSKQNDPAMTIVQAHEMCELTNDDLKLIAYQVASGVDYLNRRQIAHCDIAARNVLVNSRFIMKICDFGYVPLSCTLLEQARSLLAWLRGQRTRITVNRWLDTKVYNWKRRMFVHLICIARCATNSLLFSSCRMNWRHIIWHRNWLEHSYVPRHQTNVSCWTNHPSRPTCKFAFCRYVCYHRTCLYSPNRWSFGIFLWTLFLKCKYLARMVIRWNGRFPLSRSNPAIQQTFRRDGAPIRRRKLLSSSSTCGQRRSRSSIHRLSNRDSSRYVRTTTLHFTERSRLLFPFSYAVIRECLVEENNRPEMTRIRALLCHSKMLSKQAFEVIKLAFPNLCSLMNFSFLK